MKYIFCSLISVLLFLNFIVAQTVNTLSSKEKKNGYTLLFNGINTDGWTTTDGKTVPAGWAVSDGLITAVLDGKGGDIISAKEFSDFDLKLDYKIAPECNSGVKYFFTKYENGGNLGMEFQIIDNESGEDIHKENHLTGSFYDVLKPSVVKPKIYPAGQWNTVRIIAKGNKVAHWLNEIKILEFVRGSKAFTDAVAQSKFNKTSPAFGTLNKGHILLQEHGGVVSFKNIKIKSL